MRLTEQKNLTLYSKGEGKIDKRMSEENVGLAVQILWVKE